jgi:hypothetical protein
MRPAQFIAQPHQRVLHIDDLIEPRLLLPFKP